MTVAFGSNCTETVVAAEEAEAQVPLFTETEYVPEAETVIDCVVAPFDQMFPVAEDEVNVTFPPWQKVVAPEAEIVGVAGIGFTTIVVAAEDAEAHVPLFTETEYVPEAETVIDCVVAPFDQMFPVAEDEVNVTFPPWQKVVAPEAEIVGVVGSGFTTIVVAAEIADAHVPLFTETEYVPEAETVIDCVVAPFDQTFPVADDEVNVTFPPWQNVVAPEAEIVGVKGSAFTVTVVEAEIADAHVPLFTETEYVPEAETVIDCVVAPFDQTFPVAEDEVNVTFPPWQNVVAPEAEIVGVVGSAFTVTDVVAEVAEAHVPLFTETEYVPEAETVIDCVVAPFDQTFPVADDEVKVTFPPWQNVVAPEAEIVGVKGSGFTVIVVAAEVADVHVPLFTETEYVPEAETVIDCVVAPFDQTFPVADDEVNVTFPPWQNVVAPEAEIVGVAGSAFTITVVEAETADAQVPLFTETEYVPGAETVIDCVVAPVDQTFPVADDEVNVTFPPWQKVVAPEAEIVGVGGSAFTVTVVEAEVAEAHVPLFTETE